MSNEITNPPNSGMVNPNAKTFNKGLEEGFSREDIILPRAKLMQAMSPEVQEQGKEQGIIIDNLTNETLPESFIPIIKFTNVVKFNAKKPTLKDGSPDPLFDSNYEPGAMIWNITNPDDPRAQEGEWIEGSKKKPTAIKSMNFMALFEGQDTPVIISFSKTSYKIGRKLLSLVALQKGPIFSKKFKLKSERKKGDEGYYYIYKIVPNGKATDEEFAVCEYLYDEFSNSNDQLSKNVVDNEEVKKEEVKKEEPKKEESEVNWEE